MTKHQHNDIVVLMLPYFARDGNLPPGIHAATWPEIVTRFGASAHRKQLLDGLEKAVEC